MICKFEGIVELGDEYRVESYAPHGAIRIGGADIVEELSDTTFDGPVTVGIADERFNGPLAVDTGWGYSEYTPMDPDRFHVGDHDLIEILRRYEGRRITLWVADEPFNVLGGDE